MAKKTSKKTEKTTKKAGKGRKLLQRLKTDASVFLSSEEGKILKVDMVKAAIALGLVASAASLGAAQTHYSGHTSIPHQDAIHQDSIQHVLHNDGASSGHSSGNHADIAHSDVAQNEQHFSHATHSAHSSHSSHSSHGS